MKGWQIGLLVGAGVLGAGALVYAISRPNAVPVPVAVPGAGGGAQVVSPQMNNTAADISAAASLLSAATGVFGAIDNSDLFD